MFYLHCLVSSDQSSTDYEHPHDSVPWLLLLLFLLLQCVYQEANYEYFHLRKYTTFTYNAFKGTLLVDVCFVFPKGSNKSSKVFVRGVFLGSKGLGARGTTDEGVWGGTAGEDEDELVDEYLDMGDAVIGWRYFCCCCCCCWIRCWLREGGDADDDDPNESKSAKASLGPALIREGAACECWGDEGALFDQSRSNKSSIGDKISEPERGDK